MREEAELEIFDDLDTDDAQASGRCPRWKILVVDDDDEVHQATAYALHDVVILGRRLELVSARSAEEALQKIDSYGDIAVALVDVVMETDDAGLQLVKCLRSAGLKDMRIVLRTGFPGYAPELDVVNNYEIDDYHTKDELSRTRLISVLITSIRAYDRIKHMAEHRRGLELIVDSAKELFRRTNLSLFANGVLTQIAALLQVAPSGFVSVHSRHKGTVDILAGIGAYADMDVQFRNDLGPELQALLDATEGHQEPSIVNGRMALWVEDNRGSQLFIVLETHGDEIAEAELDLLRLFSANIAIGFRNVSLIDALDRMAFTDPLVGLPNFNACQKIVADALAGERKGNIIQVFVCDFSTTVASYGVRLTIELIRMAHARLAAICNEADRSGISLVTESVLSFVDHSGRITPTMLGDALAEPYVIDGVELATKASSVIIPLSQISPASGTAAERASFAALVHVKRHKDGRHVMFGEAEQQAVRREEMLRQALKAATGNFEGFATFLQAKTDLESGRVCGAEALLRWTCKGEAVFPNEFIPIAEQSGLTRALTDFVLTSVSQCRIRQADTTLPVAVNLSMADLNVPGFASWLCRRVDELGLSPEAVEFEITEAIAMHGMTAVSQVRKLNQHGFRISLDDFGTGYSSLAHFNRLAISTLKIDRAFVAPLTRENARGSLCAAIHSMALPLAVDCVAEGIETEEQWQALQSIGCKVGQGYLFSRPVPIEVFDPARLARRPPVL